MIGVPYWDRRLHKWGAWLATDGGKLSSTPLARLRQLGVRVQAQGFGDAPMTHEAEQETDAMVHALPVNAVFVLAQYYCRQVSVNQLAIYLELHPDTIRAGIRRSHGLLQRMLDERRRGGVKRQAAKAVTVLGERRRGRGRALASVVPD